MAGLVSYLAATSTWTADVVRLGNCQLDTTCHLDWTLEQVTGTFAGSRLRVV